MGPPGEFLFSDDQIFQAPELIEAYLRDRSALIDEHVPGDDPSVLDDVLGVAYDHIVVETKPGIAPALPQKRQDMELRAVDCGPQGTVGVFYRKGMKRRSTRARRFSKPHARQGSTSAPSAEGKGSAESAA